MKIYTRTGDGGETALFGGARVLKSHERVDAYGSVDELNALLGSALLALTEERSRSLLAKVQSDLFAIGANLATPATESRRAQPQLPELPTERVAEMEEWMDEVTEELPPLKNFVLPGGSPGAAALHHARTVCRRAERAVVAVGEAASTVEPVIRYLNRLSDLLFLMARLENHAAGTGDVIWRP